MKAFQHKLSTQYPCQCGNETTPFEYCPICEQQGKTFRDYEPEQAYGTAHDFQEHTRFGGTREDY